MFDPRLMYDWLGRRAHHAWRTTRLQRRTTAGPRRHAPHRTQAHRQASSIPMFSFSYHIYVYIR